MEKGAILAWRRNDFDGGVRGEGGLDEESIAEHKTISRFEIGMGGGVVKFVLIVDVGVLWPSDIEGLEKPGGAGFIKMHGLIKGILVEAISKLAKINEGVFVTGVGEVPESTGVHRNG